MIGKWTTGEVETLRSMLAEGKPYRLVAEALDRSEGSVEAKARGLGINPMPRRTAKPRDTLCWHCKRSGRSTCSWDRWFKPVPGWTADKYALNVTTRIVDSYVVRACPLFEEE